jgi:hypothetical protein
VLGNERDWVFITSSQLEERIKRTKRLTVTKFFNRGIEGIGNYVVFSTLLVLMAFSPFFWLGWKFYPSPSPPISPYGDDYYEKTTTKALDELEKEWKEGRIKDAIEVQIKAIKIAQGYGPQFEGDATYKKQHAEYLGEHQKMESKRNKYFVFTGIILILIPILLPFMMYFRPPYVFYWGENINVIDKRENAGKFILVGIVLAVLLSIFSNYIYDALKR